jgi:hypothetical protein
VADQFNVSDRFGKLTQADGSLTYPQFCVAVTTAWGKAHPDIPMLAIGAKNWDTKFPCVTFHLQLRKPAEETPRMRRTENFQVEGTVRTVNGITEVVTKDIVTYRMNFDNQVIFTVHSTQDDGGVEMADQLAEEFESFMQLHTGLFMNLGAKGLRFFRRFHDENLLAEFSKVTIKRFLAYTLYTQRVTSTTQPQLKELETEIRVRLESNESFQVSVDSDV